ncbi:MAG: hypothetical protein JW820_17160 [Spirochaetales bacterium]|nr:hypothetical protein [Spirochaetales bacterium]
MKPSRIVVLVLYVLLMVSMIGLGVLARSNSNRSGRNTGIMLYQTLAIALAVVGGLTAKRDGRSVVGWVVGCLLVPFVFPLILVLKKDKHAAAPRPAAGEAPRSVQPTTRVAGPAERLGKQTKKLPNDTALSAAAAHGHCDICGCQLSSEPCHEIKNDRFKGIVAKGFNPWMHDIHFAAGMQLSDLGAAFGMDSNQQYRSWKRQVMTDTTNWILCSNCYRHARGYL